jgi:single-stranded-DNA-specific exonuclease
MAISFRLAPRINAAGRLADANVAYKLLRTDDSGKAFALAGELDELNQRRRSLTEHGQAEVEQQLADQLAADRSILIAHSPNIVPGVVGLVAGKLVDRYYRPAIVIEEGPEQSRGSARSIPEFDISDALDEVSSLLVRHGGHSRAAGFTVRTDRLSELASALERVAARELAEYAELRPTLRIDAEVPLRAVDWGLQEQFTRLEPTGQENEPPLLLCRQARVREARTVGGGKHLRLIVDGERPNKVLDAVAFNHGNWAAQLEEGVLIDLVFRVEANEWQGRRQLQLNVQDLRISQ